LEGAIETTAMQAMRTVVTAHNDRGLRFFGELAFNRRDFTFDNVVALLFAEILVGCGARLKADFDSLTNR